MPRNLHTLLTTAAELRSCGASWEAVGERVHRAAKTCQRWPTRFASTWEPLYRDAQRQRFEEAGNEAMTMLRKMLRDNDAKSKLRAGEILIRYGSQLFATKNAVPVPVTEASREWADYRAMEQLARERINRLRAGEGLPAATDEEFCAQWTGELKEASRPTYVPVEFDQNGEMIQEESNSPPRPSPEAGGGRVGGATITLGALLLIGTLAIISNFGDRSTVPTDNGMARVDGNFAVATVVAKREAHPAHSFPNRILQRSFAWAIIPESHFVSMGPRGPHMAALLPSDLHKVDPLAAWQVWEPDGAQPWSPTWAAHLYRRASFGATPAEIERAVQEGCPATLDRLLQASPETAQRDELLAELGEEFARDNEPFKLRGWWLYAMLNSGHSLREKLALFWHNHFATSITKVRSPLLMLRQNQLLRKHALGSFRPFLKEMSRDVAMLIWLDSNQNVKSHPNENYAREVMELFSLGVGNYTEKDVQETARAFTGWQADPSSRGFAFNSDEHDDGEKTILGQKGKWGGDDAVRIILEQDAAARFLVGKLYRDFISETEPPKTLLEPLAERFRKSDYDIGEVVRTMLNSRLFFSEHAYLKRIKSPVEFVLGATRSAWPGPLAPSDVVGNLDAMGQGLFAPPNVKGWPGGRIWLNNATLLARNNFAECVAIGIGGPNSFRGVQPSPVPALEKPATPADPKQPAAEQPEPPPKFDISLHARNKKAATPKEIVVALAEQLFAGSLNPNAAVKLEAFLADGNPKGKNLNRRIREAAHAMMCMPEYQLC